ncbi:MAG: class I SAM-dependent methyltransferase, partial [Crocinitomicaceae bacterium]|nr:class I SAM-dependent methyltransferase [Crocinitomicaceae bacterium]
MNTIQKLLSYRFSKANPSNIIRRSKLGLEEIQNETGAHDVCPCCGGKQGFVITEVDRVGFSCDTVVCCDCDLVFNNSFLLKPIDYYKSIFGKQRWQDPELNFQKRTAPLAYSWMRFAYVVSALKLEFCNVQSVMEIGCGDGCNLYPYHLLGRNVQGFDYADEFLEVGRKRGMNLVLEEFSSCNKQYDMIILIHVFEHMHDLEDVVRHVYRLLKDEGRVYIEVPGIRNMNRTGNMAKKETGFSSSNNFISYLQYQHNYHFDLTHLAEF